MARPREFDVDDVLGKAMHVFWARGYAATSMADIYEATGLKPGSLYAAFRDKEELFRRSFEAYAAFFRATLPHDLQGMAAISAWIGIQVRLSVEDPERKGCMIVSTVAERAVHSEATRALAAGRLQEIRDFFARHLGIAQRAGEIDAAADIPRQADALLGTVIAVMSLGRAGADRTTIENVGSAALAALRPSPLIDRSISN